MTRGIYDEARLQGRLEVLAWAQAPLIVLVGGATFLWFMLVLSQFPQDVLIPGSAILAAKGGVALPVLAFMLLTQLGALFTTGFWGPAWLRWRARK